MKELEELQKRQDELQADIDKLKAKKKGPIVPWIGAFVEGVAGGHFYFKDGGIVKNIAKIIDSPLHPQFMPNDGTNPWPEDMEVQVILKSGIMNQRKAKHFEWEKCYGIIGSRPACGWAEYLKERE